MKVRGAILGGLVMFVTFLGVAAPLAAQERLSHGRFKDISLYRPQGEVKSFVLFLSGDNGWEGDVAGIARKLAERGAMVAGIDTPQLFGALESDGGSCVFPDGDLENLAHYLQGYARLPTYHTPVLVGYSSGATLAYAMIAQAPAGTFLGAFSLGFCVDLELGKPLCHGEGVHFTKRKDSKGMDLLPARAGVDWVALHGSLDRTCPMPAAKNFVTQVPNARFIELPKRGHDYAPSADWLPQLTGPLDQMTAKAAASLPPPPASLADLPLVEVRAKKPGPVYAVLLSGDGGWAGIDKEVAAALAEKGVDVVGVDSLRYFWSERTPAGLAKDVDRIVRYYAAQWRKNGVILIGYSQGADVLPFAINRLPPASRRLVTHTVLMALSQKASFEFHVTNWAGGSDDDALPVRPEALKLNASKTLCLYGREEMASLCPLLPKTSVQARALAGGHHFDGEYQKLAALILEHADQR